MAELPLTLSVDSCHSDLVRRVGLQACQHHSCWRERGERESQRSGERETMYHRQNMINQHGHIDQPALLLLSLDSAVMCKPVCPPQKSKWLLTWQIKEVTTPGTTWGHQRHEHLVG